MTLIPAERPVNGGFAEAGLTHDLGDRIRTPKLADFLHRLLSEFGLNPEANSSLLRLGDAIKLPVGLLLFLSVSILRPLSRRLLPFPSLQAAVVGERNFPLS